MTDPLSALIVGAAPVASRAAHYRSVIRSAGLLIAADGGAGLCLEAGRIPELCVGDFDSVDPAILEAAAAAGSEIRRYPREKDESDLDLALQVARERGASRVTITAAFADRLDHTLAALGTLFAACDLAAVADEPDWRAYPLEVKDRPTLLLAEPQGTIISILAMSGTATVSIEGARYPLESRTLSPLSSLGLSNVAAGGEQKITLSAGRALVVVNRASEPGATEAARPGR